MFIVDILMKHLSEVINSIVCGKPYDVGVSITTIPSAADPDPEFKLTMRENRDSKINEQKKKKKKISSQLTQQQTSEQLIDLLSNHCT